MLLSNRTELVIRTDSNGHVGSVQHTANMNWEVNETEKKVSEYDHIGPYGSEHGNSKGTIMRKFLEATDMVALNTH